MRIEDIMSSPVLTVGPDTTVHDAITMLTENGFAGVPVVDADDQVIGVFTEADAVRFALTAPNGNHVARHTTIGTVMHTPVEVTAPADDVTVVAHRMLAAGLRCLPVARNGVLVGVVAFRDVLRTLVRHDDIIAIAVRRLLAGYAGTRLPWTVEVEAGAVTISGVYADEAERRVVEALAHTVPGVFAVDVRPAPAVVPQRGRDDADGWLR